MIEKWGLSFILALTLHLLIGGLLSLTVDTANLPLKQPPPVEIIQASLLDDQKIAQEAQRLKQAEQEKRSILQRKQQAIENQRRQEQQLLQQARQQRQQEEAKIKALAAKRKAQEQAEKQMLEKINQAKQRATAKLAKIKAQQAAERKKAKALQIATEKRQQAERQRQEKAQREKQRKQQQAKQREQQALLAQQQAEEARQKTRLKQQQAILTTTQAIQQRVNQRWIKPTLSTQGLSCTIKVKLLPSGDVMDVVIIRSSGQPLFDRSAENAVRKASPLPVPKDRALFTRYFRQFTFEFNPN